MNQNKLKLYSLILGITLLLSVGLISATKQYTTVNAAPDLHTRPTLNNPLPVYHKSNCHNGIVTTKLNPFSFPLKDIYGNIIPPYATMQYRSVC